MAKKWHFDIDIVGGCNLRCPSCPVGNSDYADVPKGFMSGMLLERIIKKAVAECGRPSVGLYNWTEPFLHPDLASMIRIVKAHGVEVGLSTNLNVLRGADDVLSAEPDFLRVSVSGFQQRTYSRGHRRGNIDKVKANMAVLAAAKTKTKSRTRLTMFFHRYLDNLDDEARMRAFAESLGISFKPVWAYMMPLEKNLAFAEGGRDAPGLTDADRSLLDRLALPLDKAIEVSREHSSMPCSLRDQQMALTVEGNVMLCCAAYDQSRYSLGSYLDMSLAEIQALKNTHDACGPCMKNGLHALAVYASPKLDDVAIANVMRHNPTAVVKPMNKPRSLPKRAANFLLDAVDNVERLRRKAAALSRRVE